MTILREDGRIVDVKNSARIVGHGGGRELQMAYEELKSLDELKSNITANRAHELRVLITIANAALKLTRDGDDLWKKHRMLSLPLVNLQYRQADGKIPGIILHIPLLPAN